MTIILGTHRVLPPDDAVASGCGADWFRPSDHLPGRGVRLLPRGVQLAAAAVSGLPEEMLWACPADRRGAWIVTSTFAERMQQEIDAEVLASGSDGLSPLSAPYFSVNLLGDRLVRDHRVKGMAVAITSPRTGLTDALAGAAHALALGRVDRAVIVCAEVDADGSGRVREGAVALVLAAEDDAPDTDAVVARVTVDRGFLHGEDSPLRLGQEASGAPSAGRSGHRHLVFSDRAQDNAALHRVIDLDGECVDAERSPLRRGSIDQAVALADLAEGPGGTLTTVAVAGEWSRIEISTLPGRPDADGGRR
ncbi:hypothetical protein PlfCFBP13513_19025 [Plantibacter flavus]|uniref:hypothetical protein n=1 Tax=Plantibacter TaxID=190323 RepID=UPI0010C1A789|nr:MULTISPECIES: hypothetical protein [Plantibacter]MBD8535135.1 hypothetical protein [Plantibacter sp. CFBP 13570]TKJ95877.1 hypothetical protein PlfCFBP13513_19025 [Plantibacter flavus]